MLRWRHIGNGGARGMAKARLTKGDTLDGFRIGEVVHTGGMAHLYEVTHPEHDLPMLMKVPILAEGEDPATIVGFEMEQMIMPRLTGPHVPRFVALGDFSQQPYIVFERIAGDTLFKRLAALPIEATEVAQIGVKVATALHDLHGQHVIHLDVKPSNIIMRASDAQAVLIDFGLSHHEHLPDLMAEEFRVPYGSAPYMAPEQVFGIRTDLRSDIFALGVLMYFFATGTRPFGEPQSLKGLKRRLWQDPVPPRALAAAIPPWLQEIILKCLAADPAVRYATAAQLAFDLANPGEVTLTTRAERLVRDPWSARIKRRYHPDAYRPQAAGGPELSARLGTCPIVAAAIDLSESHRPLAEAIRTAVTRVLATLPEARLACLNVQKTNLITVDETTDGDGNNIHIRRLVQLKDWARATGIAEERISCHVLEAVDPAAAILGYIEANNVEHVVLGASTGTLLRNLLGSVATEIVQKAPCSVTVVRPRRRPGAGAL